VNDDPVDSRLYEEAEKRALLFEDMARQIRLNKDAKFGGAFLVVPPGEAGEPFASLMLKQDEPSIFWGAVKTLAEVAMNALDPRNQQGFGRR
jgi:hypothetical protein